MKNILKDTERSSLLVAKNNFADLRELANKLSRKAGDDNLTCLTAIIGPFLERCDLREWEVELAERDIVTFTMKSSLLTKRRGSVDARERSASLREPTLVGYG